jgi:hypothetical protein
MNFWDLSERMKDLSFFRGPSLLLCLALAAMPTFSTTNPVEYHDAGDPSYHGLGFLEGGRELYVGGCQVFSIDARTRPAGCRYPMHTRWASVSPDGSMVLATAVNPHTQRAKSYILDAQSGKVLSAKPGIRFAPPVAVHPKNQYWAVVRGPGKGDASETVEIVNRDWSVRQRGLYAETHRIFSLEFSPSGHELYVNGGGPTDGATLDTDSWRVMAAPQVQPSAGLLLRSANGRFLLRQQDAQVVVVDVSMGRNVAAIDLDLSREEPQAAFSQDGRWLAVKGYTRDVGNQRYVFALVPLPRD